MRRALLLRALLPCLCLLAVARAQPTVPTVLAPPAALTLAPGAPASTLDLTTVFSVPGVTGPIVRFNTVLGAFNVELLPAAAPNHVANFLGYVNDGAYANTLFHRVAYFENAPAGPSILQGGGYYAVSNLPAVIKLPNVALEYNLPNTRGTLAAARSSNPNSATSEWYFNTRDNSTILGPLNDGFGYTVFGRVIGIGITIVDTIASRPLYNIGGAFSSIPLRDVTPDQTQVFFNNLITTNTITPIPLFPSANGQPAVVTFAASSSHPAIVSASLLNGRTLALTPVALGSATLTLTATDTEGSTAQTTLAVTIATPFDAFLVNASVPADQRAPSADPDADGLPNLLEYALGGHPLSPSPALAPILARDPATSALTLTYTRARPDITYTVETTTTLANPASWTTADVTQGTPDANGLTTASIPHSPSTPRFLRLRVTLAP